MAGFALRSVPQLDAEHAKLGADFRGNVVQFAGSAQRTLLGGWDTDARRGLG